MTTTQSGNGTFQRGSLGTLRVLGWSGENPEDGKDIAFLLAFSAGDAEGGPEEVPGAARGLLQELGLPLGGAEPSSASASQVTLLLEGDQVALTMPRLTVQYQARPEWLHAARERGQVYFLFATHPWLAAASGSEITEEQLRDFVGDDEVLANAAHLMLPVRTLQS